MRAAIVVVLAFMATYAHAVSGVIGAAVSVSAGTRTTITYLAGPTLIVTSDIDTQVTLSLTASGGISLPSLGFADQSLAVTGGAGYTLAVTGGAVLTDIQLTTPAIAANIFASIAGSVQWGCLRLDAAASTWTAVDVQPITASNTLSIMLPSVGTYKFVAINETVMIPAGTASATVVAWANQTYDYAAGFSIMIKAEASGTLTASKPSSNPESTSPSGTSLNIWLSISFSGSGGSSTPKHNSEIRTSVSDQALIDAGLTASAETRAKLRWARAVSGSGNWQIQTSGFSWEGNVFVQATSEFSSWAVVYVGNDNASTSVEPTVIGAGLLLLAAAAAHQF